MTITTFLTGGVLATVIPAALLTSPIAFFLLWLYRRAVIRLMGKKAQSVAAAPTPATYRAWPLVEASEGGPQVGKSAARADLRNLLARPWQAAGIYILGGWCFTAILVFIKILASGSVLTPLKFFYLTWIFLFPACLVVNLVASPHWQSSLMVIVSYFIILVFLSAIEMATQPLWDWSQLISIWTLTNLPPLVLIATFLYPRIRAIGPMVFTFLAMGFAGASYLALGLLYLAKQGIEPLLTMVVMLYNAFGVTGGLVGFDVIGFLGLALVGWLILQLLKWLYLHKRQSDQALILDPIWLAFAYLNSASLIFNTPWLTLVMVIIFGVYKLVTWAGLAWLNHHRRNLPGVKLLVLRVFSLGKRSEQLYSAVAKVWRYVGNIQFITGPDLAASTVAPHNFLDYISGKLNSRFIDSPETLERRIAEADTLPGLDGRYPILDFFCHEDTWKMVLSRLACESDVVLMDLRSFTAANAGCKFEIGELIQLVPIEKVVFVTDQTTDDDFMQLSIQEAWENLRSTSPNKSADHDKLNILCYEDRGIKDFNSILNALGRAAA